MIVPFHELLLEREAVGGAALGAFTCYDATTAAGIILAAESHDVPVALLIGESSYRAREGRLLLAALLAIASKARVPSCVQLDHVSDVTVIADALADGVGAVMADGSRLPLSQNIELVQQVISLAAEYKVDVEAELGHVVGDENVATAPLPGSFTEPDEALKFIGRTGVSCLAVSVGNVHGVYAEPARLDWERLEAIRARTDTPLALHGASGLLDDDVTRAIALGISKVNVNTEIRQRIYTELERRVSETMPGYRLLDLDHALVEATAEQAMRKFDLLSPR